MGVLVSVNAAMTASERACAATRCEIKSKTGKRHRWLSVPEVKVKNRLVYKHQMPVFKCAGERFGLSPWAMNGELTKLFWSGSPRVIDALPSLLIRCAL